MIEAAKTIDFDPDAWKTRGIWEGPFPSREALEQACVVVTPDQAKWNEYCAWAAIRNVDSSSGKIFAAVDNPEWLGRSLSTLQNQVTHAVSGGKAAETPNLKFTLSPDLVKAFENAANAQTEKPFQVLTLARTRETLFFLLDENYPLVDLHMTVASTQNDYTAAAKKIIATTLPSFADRLDYRSGWLGRSFDLVHINSWLHYLDKNEAKALLKDIAATGAKQIALSNTAISHTDKPEFWLQRQFGGGIIDRMNPREEIFSTLESLGYTATLVNGEPYSYDLRTQPSADTPWPVEEHYLFELK